MPTAFTYGNYPHIFDAFVADTSFEAQLALRLSCKSFKLAVDRLHVHHLVLTPKGSDSVAVRGLQGRIAALRRIKPAAWSKNPKFELTSHTRVVDIRGFIPPTCDLTLLKDAFPNLDTLRMCTSKSTPKSYTPYFPFAAKTLVLFTSPQGGDCNPTPYNPGGYGDYDSEEEDEEPELFPKGASSKLAEKCTKIVVNMKGMDIPIADMFHCALDPPEHVTAVDIIIPAYNSPTSRGSIDSFSEYIVGMDTAELIGSPHVKYTLVGLDVVSLGYDKKFLNVLRRHVSQWRFGDVDYGKSPEPKSVRTVVIGDDGDLKVTISSGEDEEPVPEAEGSGEKKDQDNDASKEEPQEPKKKMTHKEKVDSILSAVETLTMKEYRERLGLAQATLQSVEYLRSPAGHSLTGASGGSLMDQLLLSSDEMDSLLEDDMDDLLNPSEEMEEVMAEFMHAALNPTPEMIEAMAQYMADMDEAFAAGMLHNAMAGGVPGMGLDSETDEDEDDEEEDEEDGEEEHNDGAGESDEKDEAEEERLSIEGEERKSELQASKSMKDTQSKSKPEVKPKSQTEGQSASKKHSKEQ